MQEELIKHQKATAMAAQFQKAMEEVQQAVALIESSENRLKLTFGKHCTFHYKIRSELEATPISIKKQAWRYILEQSQILCFLSIKKHKQLEEQIEKDQLPEITEEKHCCNTSIIYG